MTFRFEYKESNTEFEAAIYNEIKDLTTFMLGDHCSEVTTKIYDIIRSQEATEFCATLLDAMNMSFGGVNFPASPEIDFNFESWLEYGKIASESFVKVSESHLAHMLHKSLKLINQLEQTIEYREDYEKNVERGYSRTVAMIGASTGMIAKAGTQALGLAEIGGAEYAAISGIGLPAAGTLFIGGTYTLSKANEARRIANEIAIQTAQFVTNTLTSPTAKSDVEELPDLIPSEEATEITNQEEKTSSQIDLPKKFYALSAMKLIPAEPDLVSAGAETDRSGSIADFSIPEFKITRFEESAMLPVDSSHNAQIDEIERFDSGRTVERINTMATKSSFVQRERTKKNGSSSLLMYSRLGTTSSNGNPSILACSSLALVSNSTPSKTVEPPRIEITKDCHSYGTCHLAMTHDLKPEAPIIKSKTKPNMFSHSCPAGTIPLRNYPHHPEEIRCFQVISHLR